MPILRFIKTNLWIIATVAYFVKHANVTIETFNQIIEYHQSNRDVKNARASCGMRGHCATVNQTQHNTEPAVWQLL